MTNFVKELSEYAEIINNLGKVKFLDGKNLSEKLSFGGAPFWEIFSPEICWRHLVTASAAKSFTSLLKLRIKPYYLLIREWLKRKKLKETSYKKNININININYKGAIIFLGFTPRMYLDVLEPVILQLNKSKKHKIIVLTDKTGMFKEFKKYPNIPGVLFRDIWSFWNEEIESESKSLKKTVSSQLNKIHSEVDVGLFKSFFSDTHGRALSIALKMTFRCYIPLLIEQTAIAKFILKKFSPKIIISPDDSDARTRLYTLLGKETKISSVTIQYGLTGPDGVEWKFLSTNKVAVWGKSSRDELIKHGVNKDKIVITGSPRHDSGTTKDKKSLRILKQKYNINKDKIVILFASTYTDKSHYIFSDPNVLNNMKKSIFDIAILHPNILLLVKPHPVENIAETKALVKNFENIFFVDKTENIIDLIHLSDSFISFGSTSTIDALIANKLSICPIFPGWPFSRIIDESGVVLVPKSKDELGKIFNQFTKNKKLFNAGKSKINKNFIDSFVHKVDGNSAERVKNLILDISIGSNLYEYR